VGGQVTGVSGSRRGSGLAGWSSVVVVVLVVVDLGGVGQQAGQPLQVARGELVQDVGDLGLGRMPQQHHHQLPRLRVPILQPGAPAPGRLLLAELIRVGHRVTSSCCCWWSSG
jgi:hypothetical protein